MKRISLILNLLDILAADTGLMKRITFYVCYKHLSPPGLMKRISLILNLLQTSSVSCSRHRLDEKDYVLSLLQTSVSSMINEKD